MSALKKCFLAQLYFNSKMTKIVTNMETLVQVFSFSKEKT